MIQVSIDHPLTIAIGLGFLGLNVVCLLVLLGQRVRGRATLGMMDLLRGGLAEALGTFALLLLAGLLTVAGQAAPLESALAVGFLLTALIVGPGAISGGHFNPAVTIGLTLSGRHTVPACAFWLTGQLVGAGLAVVVLALGVGVEGLIPLLPVPGESLTPRVAFLLEMTASFVFLLVLSAATLRSPQLAPLAIGATATALILTFGPLTGAGFNPSRFLAVALAVGRFDHLAVYLAAPLLGATGASVLVQFVFAAEPEAGPYAVEFPEEEPATPVRKRRVA